MKKLVNKKKYCQREKNHVNKRNRIVKKRISGLVDKKKTTGTELVNKKEKILPTRRELVNKIKKHLTLHQKKKKKKTEKTELVS